MNHIREYLKPEAAQVQNPGAQVQCSACSLAKHYRCFPDVIECRQLGKMKNASLERVCFGFSPK